MNASTQDAGGGTDAGSHHEPLTLQVITGLHSGASAPLAAGETLLIGAGEDCDVILSDAGVARQHCILARKGARVAVRALDGVVTVARETRVRPGQLLWVDSGTELTLGDATLEITSSPEPRTHVDSSGQSTEPRAIDEIERLRRFRWTIAGVALIACVASPLTRYVGAHSAEGDVESISITQQAPVRTGAAVAHDVAEVLRLSGFACDAQYTAPGTVTVRGHFGDPKALTKVIGSRAMREINGLQHVMAINLDQRTSQPAAEPQPGGEIVAVDTTKDPYVVTADGSRYYMGAQLPQGGRLAGLINGEVLIERDGHIEHFKLPGNAKGPRISLNTPTNAAGDTSHEHHQSDVQSPGSHKWDHVPVHDTACNSRLTRCRG